MNINLLHYVIVGCLTVLSCSDFKSLNSIRQVDGDEFLYEMEYYGGYDLQDVVNADIDSNEALLNCAIRKIGRGLIKPESKGCKSFQVKSDDGKYLLAEIMTCSGIRRWSEKYYSETPDERYGNPHSKSWWHHATSALPSLEQLQRYPHF